MRLPATIISTATALLSFASTTPATQLAVTTYSGTGTSSAATITLDSLLTITEQPKSALAVDQAEPTGEVLAAADTVPADVEPEPAARPEITVTVIKGDSLSKIATAHQTTYNRLFDANPAISDPNLINPGDIIRIPYADEVIAARAMPAPKPTAVVRASQPTASNAPAVASGSVWDRLAQCESGGRWNINTGNGYYGGLQFLPSTWRNVGGTGLPHQHSREEQIYRAEILLARSGWGQWPQCAAKLGLL